jgi:hypothetical protein
MPDTNALNKVEIERVMDDMSEKSIPLTDYISFSLEMSKQTNKTEAELYKNIYNKLLKYNKNKIDFASDQEELLEKRFSDFNRNVEDAIDYVIDFFEKYAESLPSVIQNHPENEKIYDDLKEYKEQYLKEEKNPLFLKLLKDIILEAIPNRSKKVGNYPYKGFTTAQEYNVFSKINKAFDERSKTQKNLTSIPEYVKYIDIVYDKMVTNNPELKDIKTNIPGYESRVMFPKHDIVFGALSGIPPEDIKYFVEITKGRGNMYKGKDKMDHDTSKEYISPLKNK